MGIQKLKMITVIFILAIMTALLAGCSGKLCQPGRFCRLAGRASSAGAGLAGAVDG